MFSRLRNESGNWTLVGLLVALAVGMAIMFVVVLPKIMPGEQAKEQGLVEPKPGQTVVGASIEKGKETACASNLRQIRMSIEGMKAAGEQLPASLEGMRLGSAGVCPASNQPYRYDPATGQVQCLTPAHERL